MTTAVRDSDLRVASARPAGPGLSAAAAALAAAGTALVLFATSRWGAVVSWDSLVYLGFARDPASGGATITLFCPLFPLSLSALGGFGLDAPAAARILNSVLFGATIALAVAAVRRAGAAVGTSILAGVLVLTSRVLLEQYVRVMSDALALFLGFLGLFLVARHMDRPARWRLALAGLVLGLALATRYACLPFVAAGFLALAVWPWADRGRRFGAALVFGALAAVPQILWLARNVTSTGSALNRKMVFHAPRPDMVRTALSELSTWLLPPRLPFGVRLAFLALFVAAFVWLVACNRRRPSAAWGSRFARLLRLFIPLYAAFMLVVMAVVDASVNVGSRHWLPVYFAILMLVALLADAPLSEASPGRRRIAALGIAAFVGLSAAIAAAKGLLLHRDGAEYTRRAMQTSVLARLRDFGDRPLYTDDPEAVEFIAGRKATRLPLKYDPKTREPNPRFAVQMATAVSDLRAGGITVRFAGPPADRYPSPQELEEAASLAVIAEDRTATIYGAAP
jgi:hypothetical protein